MPIVPNFILKLEQQSKPKPNVTEIDIVCTERTILTDDKNIDFNISDIQFTTKNPKECKSERNETAEKILKKEAKEQEYAEYGDANVKAGIMFGSKALVQMLFNPFVGPITNRYE